MTYDLSGGAWTTETEDTFRKFKNDQVNVIEAVPTKTGYTFADWTSEDVAIENDAFTMPAKDVTLKAKWNVNKYTVKWVNWDGSEVRTDTEVPYGTELEAPANPTRAADAQYTYTFKGWDKPLEKVTKDDTYTAVYEKEVSKYTLDQYYYSDVFSDYRAALVDTEKNLIGFPLSGSANQYVILSYDKDQGFQVQMQEEVNGNSYLGTRGVYANEKFYVINGNAIEAYRMGDYVKIDDLLL